MEHQIDVRALDQEIANLAHKIGATVLIERDVIHIREPDTCLAQAIGDGLRGKPGPMLDAAEALLLGGRDQLAVAHERRRGIGMKGIEAENNHPDPDLETHSTVDAVGGSEAVLITKAPMAHR